MTFLRMEKLNQHEKRYKRYILMVTCPSKELGRSVTEVQSSSSSGAIEKRKNRIKIKKKV
jgi:hypothetical protein